MKVLLVTHANTAGRPPARLSLIGRYQVEQVVDMARGVLGRDYRIGVAVSSSAVRCLETAILCVEEMGADGLKRVETDRRLARLDSSEKLEGVIRDNAQEGLAVFCHADLGAVLPQSGRFTGVKDGWFAHRPVMVVMDWSPGRGWGENVLEAVMTVPEDTSLMTD